MYKVKIHLHGAQVQEIRLESGREYTFGRGSDCDVQLTDQPGISRAHFRIVEEGAGWTAQVLSKFGSVLHAGQPVQTLSLSHGSVFQLSGYDIHFIEMSEIANEVANEEENSSLLPVVVGQSEAYSSHMPVRLESAPPPAPESFDGNDEATQIVTVQAEAAFLRLVEGSGIEETIRLDGHKWIAGREEGSHILLNDRKASRRQFELTSTPQGHFIRDLGSSNGTLLNGTKLASDELRSLRSGDVLQVGALTIHFEIRDPNFEKKLMVLPSASRSDLPAHMQWQNPYEMINFPVATGPGGAVRMDDKNLAAGSTSSEAKKKKFRFYLILATVVAIFIGIFGLDDPSSKEKKPQTVTNPGFSRLSPKQQQFVKEQYVVAKNLYMQGKLALASAPLKKIHELLPEGFEGSIAMADECRAQAEHEEMLRELERVKRIEEQNRRTVETNLINCETIAKRTHDLDEIRRCLAPTTDLDPSNPGAAEQISRVQMRIEDRQRRLADQRDRQSQVAKGQELYYAAEGLDQKGDYRDALAAYKRHISSPYPDPKGLKAQSQRAMLSITKRISNAVDEALAAAEQAYATQNYKEAFDQIKKAKEMDSQNERAAELNARYRRELNGKLKEIYEESIISEGIGNVPEATNRWKKIIETDHPEGEYYKKARNKLRSYGVN